MQKVFLTIIALAFLVVAGGTSFAQTNAEVDRYVALLRKDLRSEKKQLIALNMMLTDKEATKFWPVYDQYAAELEKLQTARIAAIKDYAANFDKLTNATAANLNRRSINIDESITRLRQKYLPIVGRVLPGKKAALFFQLDKRIGLLIDLQLAAGIPLVEQ